jgi:hypothetical protein
MVVKEPDGHVIGDLAQWQVANPVDENLYLAPTRWN